MGGIRFLWGPEAQDTVQSTAYLTERMREALYCRSTVLYIHAAAARCTLHTGLACPVRYATAALLLLCITTESATHRDTPSTLVQRPSSSSSSIPYAARKLVSGPRTDRTTSGAQRSPQPNGRPWTLVFSLDETGARVPACSGDFGHETGIPGPLLKSERSSPRDYYPYLTVEDSCQVPTTRQILPPQHPRSIDYSTILHHPWHSKPNQRLSEKRLPRAPLKDEACKVCKPGHSRARCPVRGTKLYEWQ